MIGSKSNDHYEINNDREKSIDNSLWRHESLLVKLSKSLKAYVLLMFFIERVDRSDRKEELNNTSSIGMIETFLIH